MNMIRASWVVFATLLVASLYTISKLPENLELPIHWGLDGKADWFVSAEIALIILPVIILVIILLFTYIKHIEPRHENLKKSESARRWIMFGTVMLIALFGASNIALGLGYDIEMTRLILSAVMILLILIGNFLPKLRSNYFIGIRVPWTLSNEENWRKTHHFAGRVFMICGVIGLLASLLISNQEIIGFVLIGLIIPMVIVPVFYSWNIWRKSKT